MITNGRSCTNGGSTSLVEDLNLKTLKNLKLYKLQLFNNCGEQTSACFILN